MSGTEPEHVYEPAHGPAPEQKLWTGSFIAITVMNFFNFFSFNLLTTGMPIYVNTLGGSAMEGGLVVTLVTVTAIIVRPFTGILLDRWGRRGILLVSMVYSTVVVAAYAVFPVVGLLLALRLLHGVGWGFSGTAISTTASDVLPKQRFAEGMGYFAMANSVAVAIAPALSIVLLDDFGAKPMIVVACSSLVIACILAFAVKFPQVEKRTAQQGERLRLGDLFERTALLPGIIIFATNMAFSTITAFIAVYAQGQGVDQISLYFVTYALVTIVSRPLIGRVIDRIGFFGPGIFASIGVIATMLVISQSSTLPMFILAGLLGGLGIGTAMGVLQTMAVSSVAPQRRGVANSTYFLMFDGGICAGSFTAGIVASFVGYRTTFVIMAIFPLIACVIIGVVGKERMNSYSVNLNPQGRPSAQE